MTQTIKPRPPVALYIHRASPYGLTMLHRRECKWCAQSRGPGRDDTTTVNPPWYGPFDTAQAARLWLDADSPGVHCYSCTFCRPDAAEVTP